jgi:tetratricopeptide (TPR) repeat protein
VPRGLAALVLAALLPAAAAAAQDVQRCEPLLEPRATTGPGGLASPAEALIAACTRAINASGRAADLARAYFWRGVAFAETLDAERAIADLTAALRLRPDWAAAHYRRAEAWRSRAEIDRAIADYDAALRLDPAYGLAWRGRGAAAEMRGDFQRAFADYDRAAKLGGEGPGAGADELVERGRAQHFLGRHAAAYADFGAALERQPEHLLAVLWQHLAARHAGHDAIAELDGHDYRLNAERNQWPRLVFDMFLGKRTPEQIFAEAKAIEPPPLLNERFRAAYRRAIECEAMFWIGQYYLLEKHRGPAAQSFRAAMATCPWPTLVAHYGARHELMRLARP